MRLFAILALFVGLALAGTAVYFTSQHFRALEARIASQNAVQQIPLVDVVVLTKPLRYGDILPRDAVKLVKWQKGEEPKNGFLTLEALLGPEGSKPRSVLRIIEPGEPVLASMVTDFGVPAGLAQRLSPGKQAFAIRVDVQTGVSGLLAVGDHVDVYWNGTNEGKPITKLLIERLPIIAIDQQAQEDRARAVVARTVTVEAPPERLALLSQAQNTGKLSLSLRGIEDTSTVGTVVVDQTAIVGEKEAPVEVKEEVVPTVRVRKAGEATDVATDPDKKPEDGTPAPSQ